jgi:hypothetical protein
MAGQARKKKARRKMSSRGQRIDHGQTLGRLMRKGTLSDREVRAAEDISRIFMSRSSAALGSMLGRSKVGGLGARDGSRLEAAEWSADAFLGRYEPWRLHLEERFMADEARYRQAREAVVKEGGSSANVRRCEPNLFALTLLVVIDGHSCGKVDKLMELRNGMAANYLAESLSLFCTFQNKSR